MQPTTPGAAPTPPPLLTYGDWQAQFGQAGAYEHLTQYLQEFGYGLPFGKLPVVEGLPTELGEFTLLRGWVEDVFSPALFNTAWIMSAEQLYPPISASPYAGTCLAYFGQAITLTLAGEDAPVKLDASQLLRGVALALPFWPGLFGITEPVPALEAMRDLVCDEDAERVMADYSTEQFRANIATWASLALQYALFGERRY